MNKYVERLYNGIIKEKVPSPVIPTENEISAWLPSWEVTFITYPKIC